MSRYRLSTFLLSSLQRKVARGSRGLRKQIAIFYADLALRAKNPGRGVDLGDFRVSIALASLITNASRRPGQAAHMQHCTGRWRRWMRAKQRQAGRVRSCWYCLVQSLRSTWGVSLTIRSIAFVSQYETR